MDDLAFSEKLYDLVHIGIVAEAENVVIGSSRLLFRRHIVYEIGYRIAHGLDISRRPRNARRARGIYGAAVIHIIRASAVFVKAARSLAVGELAYYAADYLKVRELFRTILISVLVCMLINQAPLIILCKTSTFSLDHRSFRVRPI